jgi:NAD(P)-dependent dehydrogenase (short-subunit alcohol dehydrogenase family)
MQPFASKVAVITGGSQGLGAAIAALFAERGARGIVICGRSREKGEAKACELSERAAPMCASSRRIWKASTIAAN